jgi:hypothetical protein
VSSSSAWTAENQETAQAAATAEQPEANKKGPDYWRTEAPRRAIEGFVPGLRNLEKRLLHVEAQLASHAEPQFPMEQIRAIFDRLNEPDRKRLSELKGLARK